METGGVLFQHNAWEHGNKMQCELVGEHRNSLLDGITQIKW